MPMQLTCVKRGAHHPQWRHHVVYVSVEANEQYRHPSLHKSHRGCNKRSRSGWRGWGASTVAGGSTLGILVILDVGGFVEETPLMTSMPFPIHQ